MGAARRLRLQQHVPKKFLDFFGQDMLRPFELGRNSAASNPNLGLRLR